MTNNSEEKQIFKPLCVDFGHAKGFDVSLETLEKYTYKNTGIEDYLSSEKFAIVGGKGMGKTLLLTYKRLLLDEKYNGNGNTLNIYPKDTPFIDSFYDVRKTKFSDDALNYLSSWRNFKRLWEVAIELTAIDCWFKLHASHSKYRDEFLSKLPNTTKLNKNWNNIIKRIVSDDRNSTRISDAFGEIINIAGKTFDGFFDSKGSYGSYIRKVFSNLDFPCAFFIDRPDEALSEKNNMEFWVTCQVGLLEAVRELGIRNNHVKIYISLRQEAYNNPIYDSENKQSMATNIYKIRYTTDDIRNMMNQLSVYMQGSRKNYSLEDFLGISSIDNVASFDEEPVFEFIDRYTLGRPRDYVALLDPIRTLDITGDKRKEIKKSIQETSVKEIGVTIFNQLSILNRCLTTVEKYDRFLSNIPSNILEKDEIKEICKKFCNINKNNTIDSFCKSCTDRNLSFCELYNMGLLGYIYIDAKENHIQRFKDPQDPVLKGLPSSEYYFIHPCLRKKIEHAHYIDRYQLTKGILVGREKHLFNSEDGIFQYDDIKKIIEINKKILRLLSRDKYYDINKFFLGSSEGDKSILRDYISATRKKRKYKFNKTKEIEKLKAELNKNDSKTIDKIVDIFLSLSNTEEIIKEEEPIYVDHLTGIKNRRYFDKRLQIIINNFYCSDQFLSLLMIDIDYFKKYNDHYGHQAGDDCLRLVAQAISSCVNRDDDFAARFGGEEFIVVLPNTDEDGACKIADLILKKILQRRIPHAESEVADCVTVSIGITTGRVKNTEIAKDFIKYADDALYKSKNSGRNRYTILPLITPILLG
ncbi:MAG: GGDEF domain-containing protein [Eubacterium sp.]|jgi:diguanylate cyclase (GGDEF)-like protein|nr:GGDEF domain-containing protein [Eubacterium sp.]